MVIAPAKCGPRSKSGIDDFIGHSWRSVTGGDEASYASDFAALRHGDETGCLRGEGRFAQNASELMQVLREKGLARRNIFRGRTGSAQEDKE